MATCNKCNKEVGCGCNLIDNLCVTCYNKSLDNSGKSNNPIIYTPPSFPNNQFDNILNTGGITKEEKLRQINEILKRGQQT